MIHYQYYTKMGAALVGLKESGFLVLENMYSPLHPTRPAEGFSEFHGRQTKILV
jgi:hypothetical protein